MLTRNPGFTAVAVITLSLGIGANAAIFSVVNAVLLKPLPYADPDRLAVIWMSEPNAAGGLLPDSGPDFQDWQAQNHVFEGMSAVSRAESTLTGSGEPLQLRGLSVSPNTFQLLGVQPQLGRSFSPDEGPSGHNHVVILSYGLWQSAFGGRKNIVGSKVMLDGEAYDVVGVMPQESEISERLGAQPAILDAHYLRRAALESESREPLALGAGTHEKGSHDQPGGGRNGHDLHAARPAVSADQHGRDRAGQEPARAAYRQRQ